MADARAGVDVVVPEGGAHELLDEECLFVRAARRRDAADAVAAVGRLDSPEFARHPADRFVPRRFFPRIGGALPDERRRDPIRMRRVTKRETSLHAGMPVVGMTIPVWRHPYDRVAFDFGIERTADAAVRTRRRHHMRRRADLDQRLLGEGHGRACFDAGAARDALRLHERLVLAGGDLRLESAAFDGQRERALDLVAGAHAAGADDAHRRVERESRGCSCPSRRRRGSWPLNP